MKKIVILIVTIIALILGIWFATEYWKLNIVKSVYKSIEDVTNSDNYSLKSSSNESEVSIYYKDGIIVFENSQGRYIQDTKTGKMYTLNDKEKKYHVDIITDFFKQLPTETFPFMKGKELNLSYTIKHIHIKSETVEGKKVYKIELKDDKNIDILYVDKETKLPVKSIERGTEIKYTMQKNAVTDEDIKLNLDGYTKD